MTHAPGQPPTLDSDYRSIFENANIGLYRATPDGTVTRANPTLVALNGYASEAEMLWDLSENGNEWYVDPGRRSEFFRRMAEDGRVGNFVSEVRRMRSGERIWISENAWPVRDQGGRVIYYEGTLQDVTDRVTADRQLARARLAAEAASQAKSTFLAVMSHELRSPLNAIIGFAEIIAGRLLGPDDPRYFEYAEGIRVSGTHLLGLIGDILDLSKVGAGKMYLDERMVDLPALAARTARLFAANLSKAQVTLDLAVPEGFPPLRADPVRLGQILINLVSNAIRFTPPGGSVTVAAEHRADGLVVRVTDTGVGMTAAEAARALEPFVQIDSAFDRARSGTGLGLSICRELAALHGGSLAIDSAKGVGTTVLLHLPHDRAITDLSIAG